MGQEVLEAALTGSMRDYRLMRGRDLLERIEPFYEWQNLRRQSGLWPLGRSTEMGPHSRCQARTDEGNLFEGVNFASQDYLSLSSHPAVVDVAIETMRKFGVQSAGSPALVGNTSLSLALERKIAAFLDADHVSLFPTGWAAGFGVIKGLVRPNDHIVMDALSHACLQEGAQAATQNIHLFRHNSIEAVRDKLTRIRAKDAENGILVVTESLFSMDSDTPDLRALQDVVHEYGATLVVDVAHDLGCLGENGRGHIGMQNMIGKIDVVMGSFSKTFATNGGFVASRKPAVREYLRYFSSPNTFSNALSPAQAAIAGKCFDIIQTAEGAELRKKLMVNITMLRNLLQGCDLEVYGDPSAIVCVKMGYESLARLVSRRLPSIGLLANLVEFPAVPKGRARFRLQVMANHSARDIADAVHRLTAATAAAHEEDNALRSGAMTLADLETTSPAIERADAKPAKLRRPAAHTSAHENVEETLRRVAR